MESDEIRKQLAQRNVVVTFKKKNGDIREMTCTTNLDIIPKESWPKGTMQITEESKQSNIRAYDVDAKAWRSFLTENVISVV